PLIEGASDYRVGELGFIDRRGWREPEMVVSGDVEHALEAQIPIAVEGDRESRFDALVHIVDGEGQGLWWRAEKLDALQAGNETQGGCADLRGRESLTDDTEGDVEVLNRFGQSAVCNHSIANCPV